MRYYVKKTTFFIRAIHLTSLLLASIFKFYLFSWMIKTGRRQILRKQYAASKKKYKRLLVIVYHANQTVKNKFIFFFSRLHTYFIIVYGMRRTITRHRMNTSSSSAKKEHVFIGRQSSLFQQNIQTQSQWNVENNEKHKHLVMFYKPDFTRTRPSAFGIATRGFPPYERLIHHNSMGFDPPIAWCISSTECER